MKTKFILFSVLLLIAVYGPAMASCGTCEPAAHNCTDGSCSVTESKDSCPDGVCGITESKHDHDAHKGHKHEEHKKSPEKEAKHSPASINTPGLKTLLDSGVPLVLLDARSGKYDDKMRIPGAKSLNDKSTPAEIAKIVPNKESLVVTYCSNLQCPASHKLFKHLKSLGYSNVIEYPEGIQGWKEAGNQVKPAK
jgi:rhodanese-related sulfurtransferase